METKKIFYKTEMFSSLKYINAHLNIMDLEPYKYQYVFWKYDELSYNVIIKILQKAIFDFNCELINYGTITTETRTMLYQLFQAIIDMLKEPIKDEEYTNEEDMCFICTINKKCINLDCCKQMLCIKCNWIIIENNSKSCPFCRSKKY